MKMTRKFLLLAFVLAAIICEASVLAQDARPDTGTFMKDILRDGLGELTIINNNHKQDALVILTSTDEKPLVAVFIRSDDSFKISGISDGTYDIFFKLGNKWDSNSAKFAEKGGHYRLDRPIAFETTMTPTSDTITTRYTTWTLALEEAVPDANMTAGKVPVSEEEFPI